MANFTLSDGLNGSPGIIFSGSRDKDRGVISKYSPANCRNMGIDRQPFTGKVSYLDT